MLETAAPAGAIFTDVLGFDETAREGRLVRYRAGAGVAGNVVTIRETGGFPSGRQGRGSVHHIAFRAADDAQQAAMAEKVAQAHGLRPTPPFDRKYFRSVYFREPGRILFEIATDQPGFAVDEPVAALGRELKLPPFLEARRHEIEAALPPIEGSERAACA
jgi:glyoxalase family protein